EQLAHTLARKKARKRGNVLVDYNRDIPFAKAPLPGFYDTNEELIKDSKSSTSRSRGSASGSVSLSEVEEKKKWELEQELEEQQDAEKGKGKAKGKGKGKEKAKERDEQERQERAMAYLQAKLNKQAVEKEQLDRLYNRPRLDLPAPQVSDTEMETIVKLAQQGESAQQLVGSGSNQKNEEEENSDIGGSSNVAGNLLLGSYSKKAKVDQILSSAQKVDKNTVMVEAMNLVGLTAQQTPLLGEENTPLHTQLGTGYTGITPRSSVTQTPSYLSTSTVSTTDAVSGQRRESSQQTPSVRDEFGLNTPRQSATSYLQTKKNPSLMISRALMNLPKPKNQFEIIVPHSEDEQSGDSQTMQVDGNDYGNSEQDMEIVHKQQLAKQRKLEQQIQNRRSTPIKRGLPRPSIFQSLIPDTNTGSHSSKVNSSSGAGSVDDVARDLLQKFSSIQQLQQQQQQQSNAKVRTTADGNDVALRMIDAEMALLVANDCTVSSEPSFSTNSQFGNLDVFEDKELQAARGLITEQLATEYPNTSDFSNSHTHSTIGSTADIEENKKLLASRQKTMIEMAQQANKLEKKLHVVLGGYERLSQQKASSSFSNTNTNTNSANNNNNNNGGGKLYELFNLYENTVMQLRSFHALHTNELNVGIPVRVADLTERVQQLAHTERTLQQRYADLLSTRNGLLE
ncbi:Pre-mRNA-splicing factor CEF1, partial [Zancudomyces culisetae]